MQKSVSRLLLSLCAVFSVSLAQAGETTNSIGMKMVDIPAGSFLMGSCPPDKRSEFLGKNNCAKPDPEASDTEVPQHRVNVGAFQMSKTEVTLGQFKRFIKGAGRAGLVNDKFMEFNANGDDAPVVMVSWLDAQDFIKWLNGVEGGGYRLPSEAEWEYACRAKGNHKYCGSNNLDEVAWTYENSDDRAHAVATKKPNAFGLYDMSGNVYEWVQDCWSDNYNGASLDGSTWRDGQCQHRVQRGGSWRDYTSRARAANRSLSSPGDRYRNFGFRVARTR